MIIWGQNCKGFLVTKWLVFISRFNSFCYLRWCLHLNLWLHARFGGSGGWFGFYVLVCFIDKLKYSLGRPCTHRFELRCGYFFTMAKLSAPPNSLLVCSSLHAVQCRSQGLLQNWMRLHCWCRANLIVIFPFPGQFSENETNEVHFREIP